MSDLLYVLFHFNSFWDVVKVIVFGIGSLVAYYAASWLLILIVGALSWPPRQ
jgi:hypothetical protein